MKWKNEWKKKKHDNRKFEIKNQITPSLESIPPNIVNLLKSLNRILMRTRNCLFAFFVGGLLLFIRKGDIKNIAIILWRRLILRQRSYFWNWQGNMASCWKEIKLQFLRISVRLLRIRTCRRRRDPWHLEMQVGVERLEWVQNSVDRLEDLWWVRVLMRLERLVRSKLNMNNI